MNIDLIMMILPLKKLHVPSNLQVHSSMEHSRTRLCRIVSSFVLVEAR
jgi:hypothetical protein